MADYLIRATAAEGGIRAVGVLTTQLTELARTRHQLSYLATVALGRTMAAGLLLASSMKAPQSRINLRVRGAGPLKGVVVDAGLDGTVRGYAYHPDVEMPLTDQGRWNVGQAIGPGYLHVVRDVGYGTPYTSTVELVSGEIGDDVTYYLAHSEQTPSALALGVFTQEQGVQAAGGLLIQLLPQAEGNDVIINILESRLHRLQEFTPLLLAGKTLAEILEELLGDLGLTIFPETQEVRFACPCSGDRMLAALKLFGTEELGDMIREDQGAEVSCDFCGEKYHVNVPQLQTLIQELEQETIVR